MREIKFRAYNIEREEWDYFVIDSLDKEQGIERDINTVGIGSPIYKHIVKEGLKWWGQFTGLHDKNGKEIYEGDILNKHHPAVEPLPDDVKSEMQKTGGYVVSNADWYGAEERNEKHEVKIPDVFFLDAVNEEWEVIGNIYEHTD